jgi:hypothetical protein
MGNIDIYELIYSDIMFSNNKTTVIAESDFKISEHTRKRVFEILKCFSSVNPENINIFRFSDIKYSMGLMVDKETNIITFKHDFISTNKSINKNDYINKFKYFDVNDLPLIDIAKFLNIKIEKSNYLEAFGQYIPSENKIIMGTYEGGTFIHELVHAVDHFLPNRKDEKNFAELVAELSTVILCRIYSILNNESYSMEYLESYTTSEINGNELIKRVLQIIEYIKKCKEFLENKNNGV